MSSTPEQAKDHSLLLRQARPHDVATITALLDAASQHWLGRSTSAEQVRDRLDTPHTDLGRDTVVAVDASGTPVGFGHVWLAQPEEIRCFARTDPGHRGQGVGTALQHRLIARAVEIASQSGTAERPVLTTTSWPRDAAAETLLARVGYAPTRYFSKMVKKFTEARVDALPIPDHITIRAFARDDEAPLYRAYVESFAEHWGQQHPDAETWWRERRDADAAGYDPDLWLVALDGDDLVGFVIAKVQHESDGEAHGYIGDLGVRPAWRGRALGESLLAHSFGLLRDRGLPYVALDVDTENTTGAVRLYTKLGMEQRPSFTIWSRTLAAR